MILQLYSAAILWLIRAVTQTHKSITHDPSLRHAYQLEYLLTHHTPVYRSLLPHSRVPALQQIVDDLPPLYQLLMSLGQIVLVIGGVVSYIWSATTDAVWRYDILYLASI